MTISSFVLARIVILGQWIFVLIQWSPNSPNTCVPKSSCPDRRKGEASGYIRNVSILLSLIIMYLFIKASSVDSVFLTSYFSGNINCTIIITTEAIYIHVHLHVYIPLLQCLIHRKDSSTRILQSSKSLYLYTGDCASFVQYYIFDI